jgi:hypothetical protein
MTAVQHAGLSPERFARFSRGQQLLTIANEMNRASKLLAAGDLPRLRNAYERVLALADLTIEVNPNRSLRRELLRWRDLVAEQYVAETPDPRAHAAAFRALLQLHPETWQQLPYVTGAAGQTREPNPDSAGR